MNPLILVLASFPTILFCCFRYRKYNLSVATMILIVISFFASGIAGAVLVQYLINGSLVGKRLYGLMLADTIMLVTLSKLMKKSIASVGDFVAVPVMAICCSTKIDCILNDCCYGIILYQRELQQYRFPSQIVEMIIWATFTLVLLSLERKQRMTGMLWPFAMIWFGIFRFAVDFLRGSALEKEVYLLGMSAGKFWSLVVLVVGVVFMYLTLRHELGRAPKLNEVAKASIGKM